MLALHAAAISLVTLGQAVIIYYVPLLQTKRELTIAGDMDLRVLEIDLDYIDNGPFMDRYHRIIRNILSAMQDVVATFGGLLSAMLKTSAVVALLSWVGPWLLALSLITVLLDIAMMMVTGRYHYEFTVAQEREQKRVNTIERMFLRTNSIREIKTLCLESTVRCKHTEVSERILSFVRKHQNKKTKLVTVETFISDLNPLVPMGHFGYCVVSGFIDISSYFMYNNAYSSLKDTMKNLFSVLPRIYTAGLHGHDYFELMEDDSIRTSTRRSGRTLESIDSVEFDNVSLRYLGSDQDALSNVSLSIRKGERVAIVGTNGAGKTTLVKVLMGLYTPTSGRVLINGIDIRDYNTESLRKQFAVLFQDYYIFPFTVRENIAADGASDEEVQRTLERLGIWDRIRSLKLGLDTGLSPHFYDEHTNLSGGEQQKIAITRLLMQKRASCLILDEPTSNLDPESEYTLYQTILSEIPREKTVMVISHRLTMTARMDRIIVVDGGRVAEGGTHHELLAQRGIYARLYSLQAEKYAV